MNNSAVSIQLNNDSSQSSSQSNDFIIVDTRLTTSLCPASQLNNSLLNSSFQFNKVKTKVQLAHCKPQQIPKSTLYAKVIFLLHQFVDDPVFVKKLVDNYKKIDSQISLKLNNSSYKESQNLSLMQNLSIRASQTLKLQKIELKAKRSQWSNKKSKNVPILEDSTILCQSQQYIQSNDSGHHHQLCQTQTNKENITNNNSIKLSLVISKQSLNQKCQKCPQEKTHMVRKVSIMLPQQSQLKSSLFSNQSNTSNNYFKNTQFPDIIIDQQYMQKIYGDEQFSFINLSLCILSKYIIHTTNPIQKALLPYLLGIAVIISYKIFYDETVVGLIEYYSEMLGCQREKLIEMERQVLKGLNYELVISNRHYYWMMTYLIPQ